MNVKEVVNTLGMCPSITANKLVAEMAKEISLQHPTSMANVIRNLVNVLTVVSQEVTCTDARNEKAKEVCDKIRNLDSYIPYI